MGLQINNFRLGEFLVAISLIFAIYQIIDKRNFIDYFGKQIYFSYLLLNIFVFLSIILQEASFLNTYIYKSSSYIWLMSNIFIFYKFLNNLNIEKSYIVSLNFLLLLSYTFSVIYFPQFIRNIY